MWVILICVATIVVTYACLLVKCIYDRSCSRARKEEEEDQENTAVSHLDPTMC